MACMGAGLDDTTVAGACPDCGAEVNADGLAVRQCPAEAPECKTCGESFCSDAC